MKVDDFLLYNICGRNGRLKGIIGFLSPGEYGENPSKKSYRTVLSVFTQKTINSE